MGKRSGGLEGFSYALFAGIALSFFPVFAQVAAPAGNDPAPAPAGIGAPAEPQTQTEEKQTGGKSAIVFESIMQKADKAFVEMAMKGASQAKTELGTAYEEHYIEDASKREETLKRIAESGVTHIIAVGFENVLPVLKLAEQFPQTNFTVIDGMVPPLFPNVRSVIFRDNEGGFLVGMIAAQASKSGVIGFVGGMDVPLIRNFAYGFEQGAKYARPDIKVIRSMIGNTSAAWNNPARGSALAEEQFSKGVDVVFACAGGSSQGVLLAASKNRKLAIGVDTNQNGMYPGSVLTSLVKRVDKAVFESLKLSRDNNFEAGIKYMGISDAALDYAVDANNKNLITKAMVDKVENAKDLIIRGLLDVQVYSPN